MQGDGLLVYTERMLSILRMTLWCLLALAIPAQGFAAATRLLCGPGHHGAAAGQHMAGVVQPMPAHGHEPTHPHHHARMHHLAGHTPPHEAQAPSATPADRADGGWSLASTDHPDGRCFVCAACCTAAALPAHIALLAAPPLTSTTPLALAAPSRPAFVTGGPDRPPRPLLA